MKDKWSDYLNVSVHTPMFEIVPHTIPFEIELNHKEQIWEYDLTIPMMEDSFLLRRIATEQCLKSITIRHSNKTYYTTPGWLHFKFPDMQIEPSLMIASRSAGWILNVKWNPFIDSFDTYIVKVVLIGERAQPLL